MNLFNRSFFRLAFGFIGIIVISMSIIFVIGELKDVRQVAECGGRCAK